MLDASKVNTSYVMACSSTPFGTKHLLVNTLPCCSFLSTFVSSKNRMLLMEPNSNTMAHARSACHQSHHLLDVTGEMHGILGPTERAPMFGRIVSFLCQHSLSSRRTWQQPTHHSSYLNSTCTALLPK